MERLYLLLLCWFIIFGIKIVHYDDTSKCYDYGSLWYIDSSFCYDDTFVYIIIKLGN